MSENLEQIRKEALDSIHRAEDFRSLDELRVRYLGKKGSLTALLHQLKDAPPERKKELGALLNEIKTQVENAVDTRAADFKKLGIQNELTQSEGIDVTLPGIQMIARGSLHPVTVILEEVIDCLKRVGFSTADGPEVETEYYNFEALNTPENHPARDLQDTFYLASSGLLRSHTSPVQIRAMKKRPVPIQIIASGRVYRSDYDQTHTPMFHQVEGLMVDTHVSFSHLKGVLHYLVKQLFGSRPLRFRPSFFPFTEPSAEVDMQCIGCRGTQNECRLCKGSGWLEIGGCGMVHPNVLKAVQYDSEKVSGFAFGMGVERIAMLKYGIEDLRSFFENDYRMLEQL